MKNYPVIHPELTWRLLDGEAVIVSPTSGEIRVLNHVGTDIWQCIANGNELEAIEKMLINQYNISPQEAKTDVAKFLDDLMSRELIIWKTG